MMEAETGGTHLQAKERHRLLVLSEAGRHKDPYPEPVEGAQPSPWL